MEQENDIIDLEQEEQIETVEDTEVVEDTEADQPDELAIAKAEAAKWRRIAQRNQKQGIKPAQEAKPQIITPPADISEELRLIAKGLSDDEIEQAKVIAKGSGTNLSEALKTPLFVAFQKELKDAERKERAKLGASRGSSPTEPDKGFKSGLTREEHMALWKETQA